MEPVPTSRGPGRIILLNGASSSGKSTVARALQNSFDEPFLHVSSDQSVCTATSTSWIGEGRAHVEVNGIHTFGPYDFEVDTTAGVSPELVESTRTAWRLRQPSRALQPVR